MSNSMKIINNPIIFVVWSLMAKIFPNQIEMTAWTVIVTVIYGRVRKNMVSRMLKDTAVQPVTSPNVISTIVLRLMKRNNVAVSVLHEFADNADIMMSKVKTTMNRIRNSSRYHHLRHCRNRLSQIISKVRESLGKAGDKIRKRERTSWHHHMVKIGIARRTPLLQRNRRYAQEGRFRKDWERMTLPDVLV